jgi:hypothetical protein
VAPEICVARRVLPRGHRVHVLPPFGLLGSLDEPREGFPPLGVQGAAQLLGLLAQGGLRIPPRDQEAGMKPGPVARGLQISRESGAMPPTPPQSKGHDQQADVRVMVPVKVPLQGPEQLVTGGRHAYVLRLALIEWPARNRTPIQAHNH